VLGQLRVVVVLPSTVVVVVVLPSTVVVTVLRDVPVPWAETTTVWTSRTDARGISRGSR
jgi:hypothetical protein